MKFVILVWSTKSVCQLLVFRKVLWALHDYGSFARSFGILWVSSIGGFNLYFEFPLLFLIDEILISIHPPSLLYTGSLIGAWLSSAVSVHVPYRVYYKAYKSL